MKRLIICLDGTWNSANRIEKQPNIIKLRDMIEPIKVNDSNDTSVAQFIYYDEGVGTVTCPLFFATPYSSAL